MVVLKGTHLYLAALEREHCRAIFEAEEYDFERKTEPLYIGSSLEKSDAWYEEIQAKQNSENIRLGIFLTDGQVIGDVALQGIDWRNRSCSLGMGIARLAHRGKGYGQEAVSLILAHAFDNLGLERITADTLTHNAGARGSLEAVGFVLEGTARRAVYFAGERYDRVMYGMLAEEYRAKKGSGKR